MDLGSGSSMGFSRPSTAGSIGMGRPASRGDGALGLRRPGSRGAGGQRPASESGTDNMTHHRPSSPESPSSRMVSRKPGSPVPSSRCRDDSQHHFWLSIKVHCPGPGWRCHFQQHRTDTTRSDKARRPGFGDVGLRVRLWGHPSVGFHPPRAFCCTSFWLGGRCIHA